MDFYYPHLAPVKKSLEELGLAYQLFKLYKKNNTKVQFKLKNKPNYVFEGEILELPSDVYYQEVTLKNIDDDMYCNDCILENPKYKDIHLKLREIEDIIKIRLTNDQIAFIRVDFIDVESIIPLGYNAERFFIRQPINDELREQVYKRDGYKCRLNFEGCNGKSECCDHIIPVSVGGFTILENLQASCINCNLKKSNKIL